MFPKIRTGILTGMHRMYRIRANRREEIFGLNSSYPVNPVHPCKKNLQHNPDRKFNRDIQDVQDKRKAKRRNLWIEFLLSC
jgi:hypothetical protein